MIPTCPHCGSELGPWEDSGGCLTCRRSPAWSIADHAVSVLEGMDRPLPYWDIRRVLRGNGVDVYEPSLKSVLPTDLRTCWAGAGTYGLFRHGLLPYVRDLARVGGVYLHAADCALSLQELTFVLHYVGYRFRDISLRNALWRGLDLGIYAAEDVSVFAARRSSLESQEAAATALGLRRSSWFEVVVDRAAHQVDDALAELQRRRGW